VNFKRALVICLMAAFLAGSAAADIGMWMPHQMKLLNLRSKGLLMSPANMVRRDGTGLMNAVVNLNGGTGEFVSAEGLILTNHHVAFGALQRAATPDKDYIRDGFIAWERSQEIPASGYVADVLLGYAEVTAKVNASFDQTMTPLEKSRAIERATKALVAAAESKGPDLRAVVASMYSGGEYYLFTYKRLKDVRIVYAPPLDLGNFGGETDNWMWPRHTCDFSFLRAYVSPEGVGTDFSPGNVPYRPKSVVKISLAGVKEGDFTFIMGYPGRTYRNLTREELNLEMAGLKKRTVFFKDIIAFLEAAGRDHRDIQIKYAGKLKGLYNGLKNYEGKIEGMERIDLPGKKKAAEEDFRAWTAKSAARQKAYGTILDRLAEFTRRYEAFSGRTENLNRLVNGFYGPALLSQAYLIYRSSVERQKPDLDREPGYQDRNLPDIKERIELAERGYDLGTDRALLKHLLGALMDLPANQVPAALKEVVAQGSPEALDAWVDGLYDRTVLADPARRLELLDRSPDELAALNDPLISLAAGLEEEMKGLRDEDRALGQERLDLKKVYEAGLREKNFGLMAPDANSTLRFTYGPVKGYVPRDAVIYEAQTTLSGVLEKDTGREPFRVPEKLKELYRARDFGRYLDPRLKDVPACFLNVTNVTGGNSGSPTFNARGEQVGIIFDMTYESVTGDYYVIPELQRSISVDIRYVLFITEKFSGATHILRELGL
jgi:hypothetical protein